MQFARLLLVYAAPLSLSYSSTLWTRPQLTLRKQLIVICAAIAGAASDSTYAVS